MFENQNSQPERSPEGSSLAEQAASNPNFPRQMPPNGARLYRWLGVVLLVIVAIGLGVLGSKYWWTSLTPPTITDNYTPTNVSVSEDNLSSQVYSNERYGFKFEYPKNWHLATNKIAPDSIFLSPTEINFPSVWGGQLTAIEAYIISSEQHRNSLRVFEESKADYENFAEKTVLSDGKNIGQKFEGVSRSSYDEYSYGLFISEAYLNLNNSKFIVFRYKSNSDKPDDNYNAYNEILSTFQFSENNATANWQTYHNDVYGFEFRYPADYIFQEVDQFGIKTIKFYDPKLENYSNLRFKIEIDMEPLSGPDPFRSVTEPKNIVEGPKYIAIDSKQALKYKLRRLYEVYEDLTYPHDFITIKRPGSMITFADAGIKSDTRIFDQIISTLKWIGPSLAVFDRVQFDFPRSCPGRCSKDGKLYVGDPVIENFQTVAKDYTGAIEGNYGVVSGITHCANTCLETFLILVGSINSQPKQLDDVYIGLNPYIREIEISNKIVTIRYVPGGGNKPVPQENPETKILSYRIVDNRLIPTN